MRTIGRITFLLSLVLASIPAWAVDKIDVSNDAIICKTLIGTTTYSPALKFPRTATSEIARVKGTLSGCTVYGPGFATANPPVLILGGTFSAVLTGATNDCNVVFSSLDVPYGGSLTIKWKADPSTPIVQTSTVVSVASVAGTFFIAGAGNFFAGEGAYGEFILNGSSMTGAFTGGDGGSGSSNSAITSQEFFSSISTSCTSRAGLKKLNLGLGILTLG